MPSNGFVALGRVPRHEEATGPDIIRCNVVDGFGASEPGVVIREAGIDAISADAGELAPTLPSEIAAIEAEHVAEGIVSDGHERTTGIAHTGELIRPV
ncbi:MAG: hypothetical protein FWD06_09915, partial [Oscillospiraceae bacterium]|nr:hypothetical protein [Oscillospiraceae bacterium]